MLDGKVSTAVLREYADSRGRPDPIGERGVELLHENRAHVVPDPLVKDATKNVAECCGANAPLCHLPVERRGIGMVRWQRESKVVDRLRGGMALNDGDELQVT
jgi:hypothetical protein